MSAAAIYKPEVQKYSAISKRRMTDQGQTKGKIQKSHAQYFIFQHFYSFHMLSAKSLNFQFMINKAKQTGVILHYVSKLN